MVPLGAAASTDETAFAPIVHSVDDTSALVDALHPGDHILAIGGVKLEGRPLSDVFALLASAPEGSSLTIRRTRPSPAPRTPVISPSRDITGLNLTERRELRQRAIEIGLISRAASESATQLPSLHCAEVDRSQVEELAGLLAATHSADDMPSGAVISELRHSAGSAALAATGIRRGDRIVSINGASTAALSLEEVLAILRHGRASIVYVGLLRAAAEGHEDGVGEAQPRPSTAVSVWCSRSEVGGWSLDTVHSASETAKSVIIGRIAASGGANVLPGDRIVAVNGVTVTGRTSTEVYAMLLLGGRSGALVELERHHASLFARDGEPPPLGCGVVSAEAPATLAGIIASPLPSMGQGIIYGIPASPAVAVVSPSLPLGYDVSPRVPSTAPATAETSAAPVAPVPAVKVSSPLRPSVVAVDHPDESAFSAAAVASLRAANSAAEAEAARLTAELHGALARVAVLEAEGLVHRAAKACASELEAALSPALSRLAGAADATGTLGAELAAVRAELVGARGELARARAKLERTRSELAVTRGELAAARFSQGLERLSADLSGVQADVAALSGHLAPLAAPPPLPPPPLPPRPRTEAASEEGEGPEADDFGVLFQSRRHGRLAERELEVREAAPPPSATAAAEPRTGTRSLRRLRSAALRR